ncbi:MAG: hypothetical protein D6693_04680 [Planctomycetota bacterium]|nr:MAG: hypothetical protein D6693_04680 [Planctomycetota bacterium]
MATTEPAETHADRAASRDAADAALEGVRARLMRRARSARARRWLFFGAFAVVSAVSAAGLMAVTALLLSRQAPAWWRPVDPADPATVDLAERVERAVVSAMHRPRPPGEPWTVAVTAEQANAWLNVKLPRWVRSRSDAWPEEVRRIQTRFTGGRLSVGLEIAGGSDEPRIVAATVEPVLRGGGLWLTQPATNAGRLDLPAGWTIKKLARWLPEPIRTREMAERALAALKQEGPVLPTVEARLEDGRRVRLVGLRIDEDRLLLTCVTTRRARRADASPE